MSDKLREKIANTLYHIDHPNISDWSKSDLKELYRLRADKIIALIEPLIEEARKQEKERIRLELEKAFRLNKWVERGEAVSILLQALKEEQ